MCKNEKKLRQFFDFDDKVDKNYFILQVFFYLIDLIDFFSSWIMVYGISSQPAYIIEHVHTDYAKVKGYRPLLARLSYMCMRELNAC